MSEEKPEPGDPDYIPEKYLWNSGRPMRCFRIGARFVDFLEFNAHQRANGLEEAE